MTHTAVLRNATMLTTTLHGEIYDDKNGRFEDGTVITTSHVKYADKAGFLTESGNRYKVETWA